MTIEEIKELALSKLPSHREIYKIYESKNYYFVLFVSHGMYDTGVPTIRINKKTKKVEFILGCDIPNDIKQIA